MPNYFVLPACRFMEGIYHVQFAAMENQINKTTTLETPDPGQIQSGPYILTDTERQLLHSFNDTSVAYDHDKTVLDLFEEQVLLRPQDVAIISEHLQLTYQELNERSNQLAHYLIKQGVQAETLIPICVERSLFMVIGILGILKAGAAYVPIDPGYPPEGILYRFTDTAARFALTDKNSSLKLPGNPNFVAIELDSLWSLIGKESTDQPTVHISSARLAYVIYTSGSTGVPKGVMISHRSLYAFIAWCKDEFPSSGFDIVYASTSSCFDLSVFEIFYPLSIGKKIRILKSGLDIQNYLLKDARILINTVPTVVDSLLKQKFSLANVSLMNMAGEPVPLHVLRNLDTENIEVRNLYGPTEDTTYSSCYRLKKDKPILIGKPISNTKIYILDAQGGLVPIGIEGEICIAGDGLALGYLNKEDLSREKFIRNSFDAAPDAKMYRTGDLGRWHADGNIEYLGRMDDQVKIRGYRIELAEIEHALEKSGMVQQAIVLGKEDHTANKRLVAYVIADEGFDKNNMKSYLKGKLPEYMIPSLFIKLDEMPLTPNGKIDRMALPVPDVKELLNTVYEAPRNKIEIGLAEIWQDLLHLDRIGIHDNFFELGGDSILSMQVISRARRLGYLLQPVDLFTHDTIAKLSEIVIERAAKAKASGEDVGRKLTSIVALQKEGSFPAFFAIPGFWLYRKLANCLGKKRPFYGFEPYSYKHVEDIAGHFISEMKMVQPQGPYFLGAFCEHYPIAFEMADQLLESGEEVPLIVLIESYAPSATLSKRSPRFITKKIKFYYGEMKGMTASERLRFIRRQFRMIYNLIYFKFKPGKAKKPVLKTYAGDVVLIKASITAPSFTKDPQMGWQHYVNGEIETITIEGDHFGILNEPAVYTMAEKLNAVFSKYAYMLLLKGYLFDFYLG